MCPARTHDVKRRSFLTRTSMLGAVALLSRYQFSAAADPPAETMRIRLAHAPFLCLAPQYLAEDFLSLEGFTEWEYLPVGSREGLDAFAEGKADISLWNTPELLLLLDYETRVVVLAGVHG